jgi:hypothetical protein
MVVVPGYPPPRLFPGCLSLLGNCRSGLFAIFKKRPAERSG